VTGPGLVAETVAHAAGTGLALVVATDLVPAEGTGLALAGDLDHDLVGGLPSQGGRDLGLVVPDLVVVVVALVVVVVVLEAP